MLETIEVMRIKRFAANTAGRDFAVGDIHGHFTRLQAALDTAGFDPATDRLFSVGDLVDRGPECRDVLDWLAKPWFHPVRGNHDDYVCRFDTCDVDNWVPASRALPGASQCALASSWLSSLRRLQKGLPGSAGQPWSKQPGDSRTGSARSP